MQTSQRHVIVTLALEEKRVQHPLRSLLLFACLSELCYLLLVGLSPLRELPLSDTPLAATMRWAEFSWQLFPGLLSSSESQYVWLPFVLLGLLFTALFVLYTRCILQLRRVAIPLLQERHAFLLLFGGAALFGLTLLFQMRLFSDDVFTYMVSGRLLAVYNVNPLNTAGVQFPGDPYLTWALSGRDNPEVYGPFWLYISAVLAKVSNNPLVTLFLFKGLGLALHLLNTVLVWRILGKIAPARRVVGTLLYAWNPLALIELVASAHSEGTLLTLLLLATWCYVLYLQRVERHEATGWLGGAYLFVFGLATGTNLITLLIAPLFLWFEMRRQEESKRAIFAFCWRMALILAIGVALLLPFWRGEQTFFVLTSSIDMAHFVHAPVVVLVLPLRLIFHLVSAAGIPSSFNPDSAAETTIRAFSILVFVFIYVRLFGRVRTAPLHKSFLSFERDVDGQMRYPGFDVLLRASTIAVFWYLILVSGWFWPWFVLWLLWLVVLQRLDTFSTSMLVLSGTALAIYAFVGFSLVPLATYQAAFIFGVPLLYMLIVKKKQRSVERMTTSDVR